MLDALHLSNATMGVLALAILWVTALLVAWAALMDARDLFARRRAVMALGLVHGEIVRGDGGCELAAHEVEQVGRAFDGSTRTIGFWDRSFTSQVAGGVVRTDAGDLLSIPPCEGAEVWVTADARARAGACPDAATFGAAHEASAKARGFARRVRVSLGAGDRVWIAGAATAGAKVLVAMFEPLAWLSRAGLACVAFALAELLAAAACTGVALAGPAFGPISIVGGVLGLTHFLGVQPIAVALRTAVRMPGRAQLAGEWTLPVAAAQPSTAPQDELATRPS